MCSCTSNQWNTVIVRVCWGRAVVFDRGGTRCTQFHQSLAKLSILDESSKSLFIHVQCIRYPALSQYSFKQMTWSRSQDWQWRCLETRSWAAFSRSLFKAWCLVVSGHRLVVCVVTDYKEQRKWSRTRGSLNLLLSDSMHFLEEMLSFWRMLDLLWMVNKNAYFWILHNGEKVLTVCLKISLK